MQRASKHTQYDVEVLTTDDLWAQYGPKLPDSAPASLQAQPPRRWRRFGICSSGALFTISLHALLLSPLLLGTAGRPHIQPHSEGAAASSQNDDAEFVSTLLILNDYSITPPDQSQDETDYAAQQVMEQKIKEAVLLSSLDAATVPEVNGSEEGGDENSPTVEATGDAAGRAMLFGIYMGQIKARIERAWEHPSAPFKGKFQCKVQIAQGDHGDVKEVTLQRCNGNPAWQVSLVQAIQRASPLPAPPSDKVFTAVLTLNFDAMPQPAMNSASPNSASPNIAAYLPK